MERKGTCQRVPKYHSTRHWDRPGSESQLCHLFICSTILSNDLASLSLSFLCCKVDLGYLPPHGMDKEINVKAWHCD